MRYVTHQFASPETLTLARRWLVQLGFDPGHIETHTVGVPRIAVAVPENRAAEVELLINVAELTDPDAWPSSWYQARQDHVHPHLVGAEGPAAMHQTRTTAIGWHPEEKVSTPLTEVWDISAMFE
jgi:hypothetical protein